MARGSIKKNAKTGLYYFVVDIGKDPVTGKRRQTKKSGFKRKGDAQDALAKVINEVNTGEFINAERISLRDFMKEWLDAKKDNLSRLTAESYISYIDNHINPSIGNVLLSELSPIHIQKLVNYLRTKETVKGKPFSDSTIQRIFNIVITALNHAVRMQMIPKNVATLVDKPRIKRRTVSVWDIEQVKTFLSVAQKSRHYIVFVLALSTGMRQGEILGLTWNNVDFDKKLIRVVQTLSHDRKEFKDGAKSLSGIRSISIDDKTISELKKHRKKLLEEKMKSRHLYHDNNLVACTNLGKPIFADTLVKTMKKLILDAELPHIRFHDLRHTHATLLLKQNVNPKIVSERLGHSSVTITLDTYSHLLPNMQEQVAERLGSLLFEDAQIDAKSDEK